MRLRAATLLAAIAVAFDAGSASATDARLQTSPGQVPLTRDVADVFNSLYLVYDAAGAIETYRARHGAVPTASSTVELSRAMIGDDGLAKYWIDRWGTPLRVDSAPGKGYVVACAGSDRKFDPSTWTERAATHASADDIVLRDGELIRSPVDWAGTAVASTPGLDASRERLLAKSRHATTVGDLRAMASGIAVYQIQKGRLPRTSDIEGLRRELEPAYANVRLTDGWGHPFHVDASGSTDSYLIVSAGPDGKFDRESWTNPSRPGDDIVLRDGEITRNAEWAPQRIDAAAAEVDRLLEAYAAYGAALQRFSQSRR